MSHPLIRPSKKSALLFAATSVFATLLGTSAQSAPQCAQVLTTSNSLSVSTVVMNFQGEDYLPQGLKQEAVSSQWGYTGPRGQAQQSFGWARDYGPIRIGDRLLSYVSSKSGYTRIDGSTYINYLPPGLSRDARPFAVKSADVKFVFREVSETNLVMEGGAVMWIDGGAEPGHLFVSEKVFTENARSLEDFRKAIAATDPEGTFRYLKNLRDLKYVPRDRAAVMAELARATGLPLDHIHPQPWMPGERNGHVDMYLGDALANGRIAIPYIPDIAIQKLGMTHEVSFAKSTNDFLNARATEIAGYGLTVTRLPMFPPRNLVPNEFGAMNANFPTPVGWMIVNGKVYVPTFAQSMQWQGPEVSQAILNETRQKLEALGLQVEFDDSEKLLGANGTFHCLMYSVP